MIPQFYSMKPPAKRLVLFVDDGLRADTAFSLNKDKTTVETSDESHVAGSRLSGHSCVGHSPSTLLINYLPNERGREDVSAVTRGWQENPVEFDSVFNQSTHTWSWGSPDILPMFAKGASRGRVETFMYDAEWEDFADSDASKLDSWVFDKVKELFSRAETEETLAASLAQDKIVFFLHLLGIDTNGHAHRPTSREVIDDLKFVDGGVQEISQLINAYYGDDKTSFVFTSDHGMTDWGSHGAGLPEETMTPLVVGGQELRPLVRVLLLNTCMMMSGPRNGG